MSESTFTAVERAAHEGAFGDNDLPLPTEAQREAGTYRMGRLLLHGLRIAIEQPRGSVRTGRDRNGTHWSTRLAAHYGYFIGTRGADGDAVDVFVGPNPDASTAFVINQNVGGRFDEHKVVLGAVDEEHARSLYRASYARDWRGLASVVATSIPQLQQWLRHGNKRRALTADQLNPQGTSPMNRVFWNSDAQPEGLSLDQVLYQMRIADSGDNLLLDSVSMADIIEDSEGAIALDAMVIPVNALKRKLEVLKNIMDRAGSNVKALSVQVSDPFKQRGVTNIAALFELSDGQTVSIYFHNPDATPNKLAPTDDMISWKWLLNKRDITIVVAPERGEDLNPREVAKRIMRLAEKNSAAFQRVNAKRAERMAGIQSLKGEIAELETELEQAQRELEVEQILAEDRLANPTPAPAATIDPTTPEGYATIMGDEALMADWQDVLDAHFQSRIVDTRNALRELGWSGENNGTLSKHGYALNIEFNQVGAGRNVVGVYYQIAGAEIDLRDDLTATPEALAHEIDAALPQPVPAAAEPEPEPVAHAAPSFAPANATPEFTAWLAEKAAPYAGHEAGPVRMAEAIEAAVKAEGGTILWGGDAAGTMDAAALVDNPGAVLSGMAAAKSVLAGVALDDATHAIATLQNALDVVQNNEPINRAEGNIAQADLEAEAGASFREALEKLGAPVIVNVEAEADGGVVMSLDASTAEVWEEDFDEEAEWEATPEEDDEEATLDGDFKGHPFRGNQHRRGSRTSGTAVAASIHAKKTARVGGEREIRTAHRIAHHSHVAASLAVTTHNAGRYHRKMAKLHAKHAGIEFTMDSAELLLDGVSDMHATAVIRNSDGAEVGMALLYQDGSAGIRDAAGNRVSAVSENVSAAEDGVRAVLRSGGKVNGRKEFVDAMTFLTPFLSKQQFAAMKRGAAGEEKQFFVDKAVELANTIREMPQTYGQDGKGGEAVAYLHYFKGGADWYITEKDAGGGDVENMQQQAFGLADLFNDGGETGYISIEELVGAGVELDFHWTPKTLNQIRGKEAEPEVELQPDPAPQGEEEKPADETVTGGDDELIAAGVEAAKSNGIAKLLTSDYFTMEFAGDDVVVNDELRDQIETALGEKLIEATVPGLEGQVTLVPESMAPVATPEPEPEPAPEPEGGSQLATDKALFQSVIDGTVADILSPSLGDELEAAFLRHETDPEVAGLFEQAVNAYQAAMLTATASL